MADRQCDCTPGTMENGWQESRGQMCLGREMLAWSLLPAIAARFSRSTPDSGREADRG